MDLKIYADSLNYTATVIKLPYKQTVEGLDNLVQVTVFGNNCLITKDSPEDILYLFFPAGCKLSDGFLKGNNLYRDIHLNTDKNKKGFFELNGKVKAIKLKGVVSTGYIIPLDSINNIDYGEYSIIKPYFDLNKFKVGDEFNSVNGVEICKKYLVNIQQPVVKGDKQQKVNKKISDVLIPTQFRFHVETPHLARNLQKILPSDIISITDKWHGSSCILSYVYINNKLSLFKRIWNLLPSVPHYPTKKLAYIYSSGKPKSNLPKGIDGAWLNTNKDFYSTNIWKKAYEDFKYALEEGISIYSELVGYEQGGKYIQKGYDYGCNPDSIDNKYRMIVYRITYTKPNGDVIEFSWQQIKDYCSKYNLEHAPEFYYGKAIGLVEFKGDIDDWRNRLLLYLQNSYSLEMICRHCREHVPAEGIVVRIDGRLNKYDVYKLKSKLFVLGETNEEDVNIVEEQ